MTIQSNLGLLLQWLQELDYRALRRAERVQTVDVTVAGRKVLRGIQLADGLVLGRDRQFYSIIDGKAVVMPVSLVVERYKLSDLRTAYSRAVKTQPRSVKPAKK